MNIKNMRSLEAIGIFCTYFIGIFLKYVCFIFNWDVWTIVFGAVNNSTWETIKAFTLPYLLWSAIEFCMIKIPIKRFLISKTVGLYVIIFLFIMEFYISMSILNYIPVGVNIFTAIIWIFMSFYISNKVLLFEENINDFFILAIFMLILFFSMYLSFTVNPPHINLFKDGFLQTYGIPMCPVC